MLWERLELGLRPLPAVVLHHVEAAEVCSFGPEDGFFLRSVCDVESLERQLRNGRSSREPIAAGLRTVTTTRSPDDMPMAVW